jgi:phage I-like protein
MKTAMQMLVPVGDFPHPSGVTQVIDQAAVQAMAAAFSPERRILVDRDHYSDLTNTDREKLQKMGIKLSSEAAGWISAVDPRADGLWGTIDLTPDGARDVAAGNFRFLSPVFPPRSKLPTKGSTPTPKPE